MFTGIIQALGTVAGLDSSPRAHSNGALAHRLEIDLGSLADGLELGASVAINGVCLTLTERRGHVGRFDAVPETWNRTTLRDLHRGYGGFVLEHQGRRIYHAGDSAYFDGFKEIGKVCEPEIALLPIGAYQPESFRHMHMGPEEAIKAFKDLRAQWLVPMHFGTFKLSFEDMDEPPRRLRLVAREQSLTHRVKILEEGVPQVF